MGLLHRLAARAAGTAVALRSEARLPFGGTDLDSNRSTGSLENEPPSPSEPGRPSRAADSATAATQSPVEAQLGATTTIFDASSAPRARSAPIKANARNERGAAHEALPPAGTLATTNTDSTPEQRPLEARSDPKEANSATSQGSAVPADQHSTLEPTLLMQQTVARDRPVVQGTTAVGLRQPARPDSSPQPVGHDEPTEVHIHIGRIDITAVQEAAAPRRRGASAPPPMSLDAYLEKRGHS